jgi:hypothetical protein
VVAVPNLMLSWQGGAELSVALGLAWLGLRAVRGERARAVGSFAREACVVAVLYTIWQLAGELSVMGTSNALARAEWINRLEHGLHLPSEASVQHLVLGHPWLVQASNGYYAAMHFGAMFVFLLWLYFRHRDRYAAVRTTLALATLGCLAISLIPVAPPRLTDGFVDTAVLYHQSVYGGAFSGGADQLSAMPSVHVLWAVAIGWYGWRIGRSRWRLIAPAHTLITLFVVVCTGNHWWLDGIVAVAVLVVSAGGRAAAARAWRALKTQRMVAAGSVEVAPVEEVVPEPSASSSPPREEVALRPRSALDDVDGQAAASRLLVLDLHVRAGLPHGLDHLVQGDEVPPVAAQREPGRGDRLDARDGVALDARDLHQATDRIAGET